MVAPVWNPAGVVVQYRRASSSRVRPPTSTPSPRPLKVFAASRPGAPGVRDSEGSQAGGIRRFAVRRPPRGRLGSVLVARKRRHRMRGRFHRWIHISTGPQPDIGLEHKSDNFSIQRPLGSPKCWRMRPRGPPDLRPNPEGVREPIWIRKKCAIWTRWRPVPVKNVNFSRAPGIVITVSSDPILPHR